MPSHYKHKHHLNCMQACLDHWHLRSVSAALLREKNEQRSHEEVNSTEPIQLVFPLFDNNAIAAIVGILLSDASSVYVYEMKENVMVSKDTHMLQKRSAILFNIVRYVFEYISHNLKYGSSMVCYLRPMTEWSSRTKSCMVHPPPPTVE